MSVVYKNDFALIIDDQERTRFALRKVLEEHGLEVQEADSLSSAKTFISSLSSNSPLVLIVSDYDLGATLWQKFRMFDGYRFLCWCSKRGLPCELILHSTVFEKDKRFGRFFHSKLLGIPERARRRGIRVQAKSELLGGSEFWVSS